MTFGFDGRRRDRAVIQFLWTLRKNYAADPRLTAAVRCSSTTSTTAAVTAAVDVVGG